MNILNKAIDFHAHPVDEVFRREVENTDTQSNRVFCASCISFTNCADEAFAVEDGVPVL